MVAQQLLGPGAVAGQDGVDDRLVLGERGRDPAARPQLQAAEGLQAIVQLAGLLGQVVVVAGSVDDVVEALVGVVVGVRVATRRLLRAGLVRLEQGPTLVLGDPARRQRRARAFERAP